MRFRRTLQITDIDWYIVFAAYEALHSEEHYRIDGAVPQGWYDENYDTLRFRLGACTVYGDGLGIGGRIMFRDEILSELGIHLGYEEITHGA